MVVVRGWERGRKVIRTERKRSGRQRERERARESKRESKREREIVDQSAPCVS